MPQLCWLDPLNPTFPATHAAMNDPDGLLAAGGNLNPETLLSAYPKGIFPWYSEGQPILWWSPSQRMALTPTQAHFGRSLRKFARKRPFHIRVDSDFEQVIKRCAVTYRPNQDGTWITDDMQKAYINLHTLGHAHSVEAWQDGELVGGLYGIAIGGAFFGESMFSLRTGASKIAFASLVEQLQYWRFELIDCQVHTDYLASFGATEYQRSQFEQQLQRAIAANTVFNDTLTTTWREHWQLPAYGYGANT